MSSIRRAERRLASGSGRRENQEVPRQSSWLTTEKRSRFFFFERFGVETGRRWGESYMPQGRLWHTYSVPIDVLQLRTRGKQNQVNEMGVAGGGSGNVPAGGGETVEAICHSSSFSVSQLARVISHNSADCLHRLLAFTSVVRFSEFTGNYFIRNAS